MKSKLMALFFTGCIILGAMALTSNVQAADNINLESAQIVFNIPNNEITLTETETLSGVNVIEFTIDMGSTNTGLDHSAELLMVWTKNGEPIKTSISTLRNYGINPSVAGALVSNPSGQWPGVWLPGMSYAGVWRLRIYIADHFVGESDPVWINVVPAPPINFDLVRVDFNIHSNNVYVRDGGFLGILTTDYGYYLIAPAISFKINLASTNTGLSPSTDIQFTWSQIGGVYFTFPGGRLYEYGIVPTDPNRLSSPSWRTVPGSILMNNELAGDWVLRVYVAGQLIGESTPIRVTVLPEVPLNLEKVSVDFNILSPEITLVRGQAYNHPVIEHVIDLVSADTNLSQFSAAHFEWALNGELYQTSYLNSLHHFGLDPTNPNRLISTVISNPLDIQYVTLQHIGNWTLRVNVGGQLIEESNPIRINVIPPAPFYDVSAYDWFHKHVAYAYWNGLMSGTWRGLIDGTQHRRFSPHSTVTRAMVAQVFFNMQENPNFTARGTSFYDVANGQWYTDAITWAYQNGLVSGFRDGTFRPNQYITRAHLVLLFNNYASFVGINPPDFMLEPQGLALRAELAAMLYYLLHQ